MSEGEGEGEDSAPDNSTLDGEEPIPKLPRAKLFGKPSGAAMIRMGMFATMLYALIMMRDPCASGTARFVGQFSEAEMDAGTQKSNIQRRYPGFEVVTAEEALQMLREAQGVGDGGHGSDSVAVDASAADSQ